MAVSGALAAAGGAITNLLGTPAEQRNRDLELLKLALDLDYRNRSLALQEKQYEMVDVTDPTTGRVFKVPRNASGAAITGIMAGEREMISPDQASVLSGMRERLSSPRAASLADAEAAAVNKAYAPETTAPGIPDVVKRAILKPVTGLTVDMPEVSLPRTAVTEMFKESAQARKDENARAEERLQATADSLAQQMYWSNRSAGMGHADASLAAINGASRQVGRSPKTNAIPTEPRATQPERPTARLYTDTEGNRVLVGVDSAGRELFRRNLGKTSEGVARPNVQTFTDNQGNKVAVGIDTTTGREAYRINLGKTAERPENLGAIRYRLAQRQNGLTTGDQQIDAYSPQMAGKILQDLGRTDFITNLLQGNVPTPTPAPAPTRPGVAVPSSPEAEADAILKSWGFR